MSMFGRLTGVVYAALVLISSFLGAVFLLFPHIALAKFLPFYWRLLADRIVGFWLTFPAALLEKLFGCRFYVTGDLIKRKKPAIILMNHRTRLDWMFLWNALYKMDPWLLTTEKISLKAPLRMLPGSGWAMSCASFLFLERSFEKDGENIKDMIKYWSDCGYPYQMLLFAEGTDFSEWGIERSNSFAEKNGLPKYDYVLHPRTTGFTFLMDTMQKLNYIENIYDVTVAYEKEEDIVQSEVDMITGGRLPQKIHFDVKEYKVDDLPKNTEERAQWLTDIWKQKEKTLKDFYTGKTSTLQRSIDAPRWPVETSGIGYTIAWVFWVVSSLFFIQLMVNFHLVQALVVLACVFYIGCHFIYGGMEFLAITWFNQYRVGLKKY